MADAVISVVAERVAALIEDQILRQLNLVRGVEEEVGRLSDKLKTIRNVLDDAENRGAKEQSVKNWLKKLEDVAYEMDDILDEWNYTLLNHKMEEGDQSTDPAVAPAKQKVCCSFLPSSSCLCFKKVAVRHKTRKKIENVKAKIDMILKEKDDFKFEPSLPKNDTMPKPPRVQSTSSIEVEKIHGLDIEKNKNDIVKKLMMDNGDSEILSIVGMGGLGKTTLAQLVYNDSRVKDSFDLKIWICVSDPFDVDAIARGIVNSVGKESIPQGTNQLDLALQKLRNSISGKKFLLVLDDVWTEDYAKWEPLKINLKEGAPGSKIMVTTRKESVAKMMMRGNVDVQIYRPEKLTEEECWMLLRSISLSGKSEEECEEFEDVGKKIATKCEGLPLAANVLGSLLQFKNSLEEWESVLKSEIWQLEEAQVDLFPHLLLSYNELSPTLKRCFSYCAVYPKDSEIKVESLIKEWMALGYLGSVTGNGGVELKGRDYLNNLAMRSLFQEVKKSYGSIVLCKMHDIVHDFALFLRGNNDRLHAHDEGGADVTKSSCQDCSSLLVSRVQKYRSLVLGVDSPTNVCDCLTSVRVLRFEWSSCDGLPQGMKKLIHLRWLELSGNKLSEEDLKIICRLYFLQTLLLSSCSLKKIPIEIGNLVQLRHLGLNCNDELKELPESICSLVELRFLNLEFCSILRELPKGIHRLRNLQHLFIQETPASRCLPQELGELSGLHTLSGYCAGSGCSKLGLLKKLNGLRALIFKINFTNGNDLDELVKDAEEAELRSKEHIHRLDITFNKDEMEGSSSSLRMEVVMEALKPYQQKLNELVIGGYGGSRLPQWISSPLSRVKIISLGSFDELSSLPALGKLPFLEILTMDRMKKLKVVGRELLGIESSPSSSSSTTKEVVAFPKLKQLYIFNFPKWLEWEDITAEEEESSLVSIMPCLEELCIRSCDGLKKLPHRLLRKASLSLRILHIVDSPVLLSQYGDENGSEWKSISQNNPQLRLCSHK